MKFFRYSSYLLRHKWFVFIECCKLGMFWTAIFHDISKFRLGEFIPYMNHFGSNKRVRDKTGYYKPTNTGDVAFDVSWFYHQRRNPHHWQYWVMPEDYGDGFYIFEMPMRYRKEMLADWNGVAKAQGNPDVKQWYISNKSKILLAPNTRFWIEKQLGIDGTTLNCSGNGHYWKMPINKDIAPTQ